MINGIGAIDARTIAGFAGAMNATVPNALKPVNLVTGDLIQLARTEPLHYTSSGQLDAIGSEVRSETVGPSFQDALLKAMDGVNADQNTSESMIQRMLVDPDSVDAHDVTIAMSQASMSLNIARTVLDRIVRGWKEVINTR